MKKTLKNVEIINIVDYLNSEKSIAQDIDAKFTMDFLWKLRKNIKKIDSLCKDFYSMQEEIVQKYQNDEYSFLEEENGTRCLKEEFIEEYSNAINELLSQENEIELDIVSIDKVCVGGLEGMDKVGMSLPELEAISFMIEDLE